MSGCCSRVHIDSSNKDHEVESAGTSTRRIEVKSASKTESHAIGSPKSDLRPRIDGFDDIENGQSIRFVHISIIITGMTCTGCAKKAMNALSRIPGVAGARVNFMTSLGELDLNPHIDPAVVISKFEHESGFKCSRHIRNLQHLDVVMSISEAKRFEDNPPAGVDSVSKIDKKTCSISFDPAVTGARSVFSLVSSRTLARPRDDSALNLDKHNLVQMVWVTVLAIICTIPVVVVSWSNNRIPNSKRSIISLVLATCVQAIAVREFYVGALKSLIFSKVIEMDMLIAISTTAAYGYSVIAFALTSRGYNLEQGEIFETSTLLTTLVLVGRLISHMARSKALAAVSMQSLQAETALLVNKYGKTSGVDARLLEYGDIIMIPPHAKVVTDGKIIDGSGDVDESAITGESTMVAKGIGSSVSAGTMNGSSPLTIRLMRLPGQNSITDLADLVGNALTAKPRVQELADRVASWFIPVVIGVSCVVFAVWISIGFTIRNEDTSGSVGLAISYGIAVLAVSCPCALGLAVPMVLIIAGGVAAKSGIVIKRAFVTERAYKTTDVVFDKTGTLTTGKLEMIKEEYYDQSLQPAEVKPVVLALVEANSHPVSSALANWLQSQQIKSLRIKDIQSTPGAGISATWDGEIIKAGNPFWLGVGTHPDIYRLVQTGTTILAFTVGSKLVAAYGLRSTLRTEAKAVVEDLSRRQITSHVVSGDGIRAVEDVAQAVGIDEYNVASCQTPSSKRAYVKQLIDEGKTVLFCGDGTNDAVAVAQSHIGVQIGSTSDITRAAADVVLTGGLDTIPALLDISKEAFMRIVFNFFWSALYNLFAILLSAGAFVKVRIPPAYAGLGEIVSVLPVVLIALTLMGFKRKAL